MKLAKYGLATVLAFGTLVGTGAAALAAEEDMTTEAVVNFTPSTDITEPVDPTDPTNPVTPVDPEDEDEEIGGGGTQGPLSIDFASKLFFGENKITSKDEVYNVKAQPVKDGDTIRYVPNYVQVTDNRGTLDGWTLSVQQNGQFETKDGDQLVGAEIAFTNGELNSVSDSYAPSTMSESFELDPDGSRTEVIVAGEEEGAGTWAYYFGSLDSLKQGEEYMENDSITLSVPGSAVKLADSYSTSLTWTLSDVPGNDVE